MKRTALVIALVIACATQTHAALWKNTAGQKVYCYAWDTAANAPKTGDAANISATISKDGGASAALTDTTATEIGNGVYVFDLTQAETNADVVAVMFTSSTTGVQCQPIIAYTQPVVRQADIAQVDGTAIPTPTVSGYLPVDTWYVRGATPANDSSIAQVVRDELRVASGTVSAAGIDYVQSTNILPDWPLAGSWQYATIVVEGVSGGYGIMIRQIQSVDYAGGTFTFHVAPAFPVAPSVGNTIRIYPFGTSSGDSYSILADSAYGNESLYNLLTFIRYLVATIPRR